MFEEIPDEFPRVRNRPIFEQKAWAIAHGFEKGGFG